MNDIVNQIKQENINFKNKVDELNHMKSNSVRELIENINIYYDSCQIELENNHINKLINIAKNEVVINDLLLLPYHC